MLMELGHVLGVSAVSKSPDSKINEKLVKDNWSYNIGPANLFST